LILDPSNTKEQQTDQIADWLSRELNSPDHRPVFLKAAWRLSLDEIRSYLTLTLRFAKKSKIGYFIKLVKEHPNYEDK
jgi:hypothetical protein